jgi:hypothetical protein
VLQRHRLRLRRLLRLPLPVAILTQFHGWCSHHRLARLYAQTAPARRVRSELVRLPGKSAAKVGEINGGLAMAERNLQTCFISAPLGVDTRPLREALSERGVTVWDAADILTGSRVPQTIKDAIADVDFVCAVIPAGADAGNVYFELGLAVGADRPRLLFVETKIDLPFALRGQVQARASLNNVEALRFHLDAFLKNAGKGGKDQEPVQDAGDPIPNPATIASALDQLVAWETRGPLPQERELVDFLADVFEAAGYVLSTGPMSLGQRDFRPDLAVWIDELQSTIGNPLIVEVASHPTPTSSTIRQLQLMLLEDQSPLGLLVSWQPVTTTPISDDWHLPIVVVMGVRELVEAIGRSDFARTLLEHRNGVVHSAA